MMIDKVSGIGPGYEPKKPNPVTKSQSSSRVSDNVTISSEASLAAEVDKTTRLALQSQDPSRVDKLKEVKARLERGDYDNPSDEILSKTFDRISDVFFNRI